MHDIGKVGTPITSCSSSASFTPEEFDIAKRHASIGWSILRDSASPMLQLAAEIANSHHERNSTVWASEWPRGEAIRFSGRIVAVADVFDALTSERPLQAGSGDSARGGIARQNRGSHFDPACVDAFFSRWEEVLEIRERYADEAGAPEAGFSWTA